MVIGHLVNIGGKISKINQSQARAQVASHRFLSSHYFMGLAPLASRTDLRSRSLIFSSTKKIKDQRFYHLLLTSAQAVYQRRDHDSI